MVSDEIHVSIIMPAYNAEHFIVRAIDSILLQTDRCWELIVVNDGSIDNTRNIIESYLKRDGRIHLINQDNQGVSIARQRGVDASIGEYCIHVDADDWVEPDFVDLLYATAKERNADLVWCNSYRNENEEWQHKCLENSSEMTSAILRHDIWGVLWNKLIRRDICQNKDVCFPSGCNMWEDVAFVVSALIFCNTIVYINKPLYHYNTVNTESLLHIQFSKNMNKDIILAIKSIQKIFDKYNVTVYHQEMTSLKLSLIRDFIDDKRIRDYGLFMTTFPEVLDYIYGYEEYPLRTKLSYFAIKNGCSFFIPLILKIDSMIRRLGKLCGFTHLLCL